MTPSDLLRFFQQGDPEAAAYLNDPNSRPEIGRSRPPMFPPPPQATMGPDGMRLPLPRIQGGAMPERQRIVANPLQRYPLVYGPSVADANTVTPRPPQLPAMTPAPTVRFRDAAAPLGPEMVDNAPPPPAPDAYFSAPTGRLGPPNATEALTPAHMGTRRDFAFTGRYLGGDRGKRESWAQVPQPPQSAYQDIPARDVGADDDAAWNAARARVQAEMGRQSDPTGMRAAREGYLRPYSARAQRAQMIADGRARLGRPSR
jgi:hypothetical protein